MRKTFTTQFCTAIVFALFIFQTGIYAQNAGAEAFPRLEPDPLALSFHRPNPRDYTWQELAEISLWASGVEFPGAAGASYLERIFQIAESINQSSELPADEREKAEFILEYMHRNVLSSYSLPQTRIDTMLSNGRFNCVSSAVLYMILSKSAGLDVSGVVTRDHAFVTVLIDGYKIDVETTTRFGFDPGNRREFHDEFGRVTGFTYVPPRNDRDRQAISPIELVSLIQRNRIAELESRNRFAEAVSVAVDRTTLLLGDLTNKRTAVTAGLFFEDPYQNLMDRIFNFGASLLRAGREEDCLRWAALASPKYPDERRWAEFTLAAVNNRITRFVRANQFAEARVFLDAQKSVLNFSDYERFASLLTDTELTSRANSIRSFEDGANVITAIQEALENQRIGERRANELLTFSILRTASIITAAPGRDWLAGIDFIENAIASFGSSRELEQALQSYRNNRATDFHNRFAAAWNRRNFDEAERILNEGLAEFPNDRRLLANRDQITRHR